jgi:hypothetical protein
MYARRRSSKMRLGVRDGRVTTIDAQPWLDKFDIDRR